MRSYQQTVQVVIGQQMHGKQLLNILHCRCESPLSVAGLDALGLAIASWISTSLAPELSEDLAWVNLLISSIDDAQPLQSWYPIDPIVEGGVASPALPANNAAMVRLLTGFLGATNKGRQYHGGITEGQVSANGISQTLITGLNAAYIDLISALALATPAWEVVIAQELSADDELPGTTQAVILGLADDRVHDMGRRLNNR